MYPRYERLENADGVVFWQVWVGGNADVLRPMVFEPELPPPLPAPPPIILVPLTRDAVRAQCARHLCM